MSWELSELPELQPGDIFLSSGSKGWKSALGHWFMHSRWLHAGLIEDKIGDDYGILESIPRGVGAGLLHYHYGNEDIAIYRLRDVDPATQVKVIFDAKRRGRYLYDYGIAFRIIERLGFWKAIKLAIDMMLGRNVKIPHKKDCYIVCSEGVQESYDNAGVPLGPSEYLLLPRDIAALRKSKLIQIYGNDVD